MVLYLLIFALAVISVLLFVIFFKYSNLKTTSIIFIDNHSNLKNDNLRLYAERDEYIKKIEHLSTNLALQEEIQNEALKNSKSVLYDLSN